MRYPGMRYTKPMFDCRLGSPMPKDYAGPATHHDVYFVRKSRYANGWIVWRKCKACGDELGEYPVATENLPRELSK